MIISKCPLRVSLAGGSTDLQEFIDEYSYGSVISFPVNLYTYITLIPNIKSKSYKINYSSTEETTDPISIKNDIAREVIIHFNLPPVVMSFNADIPTSGSGLASSSSYMIACIKAACEFKGISMSQFEICKLALKLERKFNPLTGYQDTYGCGIGSLKRWYFYSHKIHPEYCSSSVLNDYKMYLVPSNSKPRSSTNILKTVDIKKSFYLLSVVNDLYRNLDNEENFFKYFNLGWENKKQSSSHIMDKELAKLETNLIQNYNIKGIKLCGAGGGGYFLVITKDIIKEGKQITIDNIGVQSWKI